MCVSVSVFSWWVHLVTHLACISGLVRVFACPCELKCNVALRRSSPRRPPPVGRRWSKVSWCRHCVCTSPPQPSKHQLQILNAAAAAIAAAAAAAVLQQSLFPLSCPSHSRANSLLDFCFFTTRCPCSSHLPAGVVLTCYMHGPCLPCKLTIHLVACGVCIFWG